MGRQSISKNHILLVEKISGSSPDRGANKNSNSERPVLVKVNSGNVSKVTVRKTWNRTFLQAQPTAL
jgi:hypothetical protein